MRLFIAEKPSLGKAIADGLGKHSSGNGFYSCNDGKDIVTWCFGHILEQASPEDYGEQYKKWAYETLPICPDQWKLKIKPSASKQYKVIKDLCKKAEVIVNAGDPDREGQLLVDEVIEHLGVSKKPIMRILLNALDLKSVKAALKDLRKNEDFIGLRNSAMARSHSDWLQGMNFTRKFTLEAREAGIDRVIPVGRVKTPTTAIVVRREKEITNFKPAEYYRIKAEWKHSNGKFTTYWEHQPTSSGLDSENRLIDKTIANAIVNKVSGQDGIIRKITETKKTVGQRLPYSLSSLQIEAGKRFGYSPKQVLDAMQSLYEDKLTTYPRSDCEYLPENQFSDAETILRNLTSIRENGLNEIIETADSSTRSKAWNDKKISAHHAIIPTTMPVDFSQLDLTKKNLYFMVAQAYVAQFLPVHIFLSTAVTVESENEIFVGHGKQILQEGWKVLYRKEPGTKENEDEQEDSQILPEMEENDNVTNRDILSEAKITKPPSRFTPASLLEAMKNIYKYVKDEHLKKTLKDCKGIGTEATRATIIDELQKFGLLELKKKFLIPTETAITIISVLPEELTYPDMTAQWENQLNEIAEGQGTADTFEQQQIAFITKVIQTPSKKKIAPPADIPLCPACHKPLKRRRSQKGDYFWGCSGYPDCKVTAPDKKGKPDFAAKSGSTGATATCPKCNGTLKQIKGKNGIFWACQTEGCKTFFDGPKTKPIIVKCPGCEKDYLHRRESKKFPGKFFWSCGNYDCKAIYNDKSGKPDLTSK